MASLPQNIVIQESGYPTDNLSTYTALSSFGCSSSNKEGLSFYSNRESKEQLMQLACKTIFEQGDGDDSNNKGGKIELHTVAMNLGKIRERNDVELALDADEWGAIPGSPDSWTPYEPKYGAPSLDNLDNPGGWSEYTYEPKYTGSRENRSYFGHFTPG